MYLLILYVVVVEVKSHIAYCFSVGSMKQLVCGQ